MTVSERIRLMTPSHLSANWTAGASGSNRCAILTKRTWYRLPVVAELLLDAAREVFFGGTFAPLRRASD
jgi:hypothetical protein